MRFPLILALAPLVTPATAQVPEALAPLFPLAEHPDRFYEVVVEEESWGRSTGWVHVHWTRAWETSGEVAVTRMLQVQTFHDPDLRLAPVMEEHTLAFGADGAALVRRRSITAELPDEVVDLPAASWVLPIPLEEGREWGTDLGSQRAWSKIVATDAANPNALVADQVSGEGCLQTLTVAAERRSSGAVAVGVTETWWAPGLGPVEVHEWHGVSGDVTWEGLDLAALAERRGDLPRRATMRLVPPAP